MKLKQKFRIKQKAKMIPKIKRAMDTTSYISLDELIDCCSYSIKGIFDDLGEILLDSDSLYKSHY